MVSGDLKKPPYFQVKTVKDKTRPERFKAYLTETPAPVRTRMLEASLMCLAMSSRVLNSFC